MSNGEDLIDSWEEIDESGLTEKLQRLQTDRRKQESEDSPTTTTSASDVKKPMRLLQRNSRDLLSGDSSSSSPSGNTENAIDDPVAGTFQPVVMVLHKPADEYQSANYAGPLNTQTVKILRRPTQSSEPRGNGLKPKQPIKTLQQREQEYAEARLRILGAAKNPEDDAAGSNNNTSSSTSSTPTNSTASTNKTNTPKPPVVGVGVGSVGAGPVAGFQNSYMYQQSPSPQQQQLPQQQHLTPQQQHFYYHQQNHQSAYINRPLTNAAPIVQHQGWSPVVGGNVSSAVLRQQQESILRMPRGPDGTGFQMRR